MDHHTKALTDRAIYARYETSCYICLRMQKRKPDWRQEGGSYGCKLCNNDYCNKHAHPDIDGVCEMNHETYCSKADHKALHAPVIIFRNMAEREEWILKNGMDYAAGSYEDDED